MNPILRYPWARRGLALLLASCPWLLASAAENPLASDQETSPQFGNNRVSVSYRLGLNMSVKFNDVGGFPALSSAKTTLDGAPYNYDDGYVLEDVSHRTEDTWYWGHERSDPNNPDLVSLTRSEADSADYSFDDPRHGIEITYWRRLGVVIDGHWGLIGAFNLTSIENHKSGTFGISGQRQTDQFELQTPPPPEPPYYGTYDGPLPGGPARPILSRTPTSSSSTPVTAMVSGRHEYEADLLGFRLGPYMVVPLSPNLTLDLSGGLALAIADSTYRFRETVTLPPLDNAIERHGASSETDFLTGAFASAELWYALTTNLGAFLGAQYQYLPSSTHRTAGKEVTLDLTTSVFITAGLTCDF